jgi:hypothetical protein
MGPRPDASQVLQNIYDPVNNAIQVEIPSSAPIPVTGPGGAPVAVTVENTGADPVPVQVLNDLIPEVYDAMTLTYYASGPGVGQVDTVVYHVGGQSGSVVATLTLTYNGSGQVQTVTRT